jgi:hypothetical protein
MPSTSDRSPDDWNSSERRAGVDKWPETDATVTGIEQPFVGGRYDFLSVVSYTFKDASGEYFAGKYQTRTVDLPDGAFEGATIRIRYNPKNPNKSWSAEDYYRSGFGRFQAFDYRIALLCLILLTMLLVAAIEAFHIRLR